MSLEKKPDFSSEIESVISNLRFDPFLEVMQNGLGSHDADDEFCTLTNYYVRFLDLELRNMGLESDEKSIHILAEKLTSVCANGKVLKENGNQFTLKDFQEKLENHLKTIYWKSKLFNNPYASFEDVLEKWVFNLFSMGNPASMVDFEIRKIFFCLKERIKRFNLDQVIRDLLDLEMTEAEHNCFELVNIFSIPEQFGCFLLDKIRILARNKIFIHNPEAKRLDFPQYYRFYFAEIEKELKQEILHMYLPLIQRHFGPLFSYIVNFLSDSPHKIYFINNTEQLFDLFVECWERACVAKEELKT